MLRHRFLGVTVFFYGLATGCFIMMSYYAKSVGNLYEEENEKDDGNVNSKSETELMDPKTNRP